jgi:hypothetical protein
MFRNQIYFALVAPVEMRYFAPSFKTGQEASGVSQKQNVKVIGWGKIYPPPSFIGETP